MGTDNISPPPPSFITFTVFACQDTFMVVEMIASLLIKSGVSLGAPYNLSQCSQQQLLVCSWVTDTCTNSPDVLPDTGREFSSLQHFPHRALHPFFPTSALAFFTYLNFWAFAFGDNENLKNTFALHSNCPNNLKKNIPFDASHFCWESCVWQPFFFNVTGKQASLPHSILYRGACIVANSCFSIQHRPVAWFICISGSQRNTSALSVLKCGT